MSQSDLRGVAGVLCCPAHGCGDLSTMTTICLQCDLSTMICLQSVYNDLKRSVYNASRRRGLADPKLLIPREKAYMAEKSGVPFVAEYITLQRAAVHEAPEPGARVLGYLDKGEVIAVTQVVYRTHVRVHRMRWNVEPQGGWVQMVVFNAEDRRGESCRK